MAMQPQEVIDTITQHLTDATVELIDLAGDGDHYKAIVTSAAFVGKSKIQQHQLVYASFGSKMGTLLHALALETRLP